ncbi:hypothetical protein CBL_05910 [Carabus blaptoides fortunei]
MSPSVLIAIGGLSMSNGTVLFSTNDSQFILPLFSLETSERLENGKRKDNECRQRERLSERGAGDNIFRSVPEFVKGLAWCLRLLSYGRCLTHSLTTTAATAVQLYEKNVRSDVELTGNESWPLLFLTVVNTLQDFLNTVFTKYSRSSANHITEATPSRNCILMAYATAVTETEPFYLVGEILIRPDKDYSRIRLAAWITDAGVHTNCVGNTAVERYSSDHLSPSTDMKEKWKDK